MVTTSSVHAGFLPHTTINHQVLASFTVNKRIIVDAQIEDSAGVTDARCYFKADPDNNYFYVSMHQLAENNFQCILPAYGPGVETVEYFFLTVNGGGQVIRSTPYLIPESNTVAATGDKIIVPASEQLKVYSELGDSEIENSSIIDPQVLLMMTEQLHQLYGLRAGIYNQTDIPDSSGVMQGFFGGFILNPADNTVEPVQGSAPGLKPLTTRQSPGTKTFSEKGTTRAAAEPANIAGNNWKGYFFRSDDDDNKMDITASISQNGTEVSITTSRSDLGHHLTGTINSYGDMLVYDSYDDEDWSTHYGPASYTQVKILDYIWPPEAGEPVPPLNAITLYRPPKPPQEVKASDGIFTDKIAVTWSFSAGATSYLVYDCSSQSTDDCRLLATIDSNHYDDRREIYGSVYYRVKACDKLCSGYSGYDTGFALRATMAPILFLLL